MVALSSVNNAREIEHTLARLCFSDNFAFREDKNATLYRTKNHGGGSDIQCLSDPQDRNETRTLDAPLQIAYEGTIESTLYVQIHL